MNLANLRTSTRKWQLAWLKPICDMGFNELFTEEHRKNVEASEETRLVEEYVKRVSTSIQEEDNLPEREVTMWAVPDVYRKLPDMCGYAKKDFCRVSRSSKFKFAGKVLNEDETTYLLRRNGQSGQRIVYGEWWDITSQDITEPTAQKVDGTTADVIGQMMSVHHWNAEQKLEPCVAYGIRLLGDKVAIFRMEMTPEQLEAVCEKGVIPKTKLQVDYTPKGALSPGEHGVSVLTASGRDWFVRMMVCIRDEMLARELPPTPKRMKVAMPDLSDIADGPPNPDKL